MCICVCEWINAPCSVLTGRKKNVKSLYNCSPFDISVFMKCKMISEDAEVSFEALKTRDKSELNCAVDY